MLAELAAFISPEGTRGILFPPLGDVQHFAMLLTVAACGLCTYVIFLAFRERAAAPTAAPIVMFLVWIALAGFQMALYIAFVRVVPIPADKTSRVVSVGWDRTPLGQQAAQYDDVELLRRQTPDEDQIRRIWTYKSIAVARASLWLGYTLLAVLLVAIASTAALQFALEKARNSNHHTRA